MSLPRLSHEVQHKSQSGVTDLLQTEEKEDNNNNDNDNDDDNDNNNDNEFTEEEEKEGGEEEDEDEEEGEEDNDKEEDACKDLAGEMVDLLFALSLALCTEHLTNGLPQSTLLVYFSGILGFSDTANQFLPARVYTSYLSGLIYIQRLLFLEQALPFRAYPSLGIDRRPHIRQLARLKHIREHYMVVGAQSAFKEFLSLRSYRRIIAHNDGQIVGWGGEAQLSMGQFRLLPEHLIEQASRLCGELMFGWEPPIADLANIKDEMSNTSSGYSFVTDPGNNISSAYLELFRRACISRHEPLSKKGH
ncbi:recQ helicase-like protein [Thelonectria olida]|uniref:RecQ helicase-like protein n=1 Tax=Thelonectria olida TaxID=1576542 RepID=A0A9P8VSD6_9HYPO|nr:recQ helicase-like protein [Thelonectria olida]